MVTALSSLWFRIAVFALAVVGSGVFLTALVFGVRLMIKKCVLNAFWFFQVKNAWKKKRATKDLTSRILLEMESRLRALKSIAEDGTEEAMVRLMLFTKILNAGDAYRWSVVAAISRKIGAMTIYDMDHRIFHRIEDGLGEDTLISLLPSLEHSDWNPINRPIRHWRSKKRDDAYRLEANRVAQQTMTGIMERLNVVVAIFRRELIQS